MLVKKYPRLQILTILLPFLLVCADLRAQSDKDRWIDSVFFAMDESQRVSQLFIVPLSSDWEKGKLNNVEQFVKTDGVGGLLFTSGHPERQLAITNDFQSQSKTRMLIAMD